MDSTRGFSLLELLIVVAIILIIASVITPLSTNILPLAFALFLLGLGWNFCFVAGSSLLSDALRTNERGKAQGASEFAVSLSSGLGSLMTGAVFAAGGMAAIGAVGLASSLALVAALIGYGLNRKRSLAPT